MRQFSLTRVPKCTKAPSEIENTRTFASVFNRAKKKKIKDFHFSATIPKIGASCAQGALDIYYRLDRMCWYTNLMALAQELDPNDCKNVIRNLNVMDSAELNKYSCNGSFTYFDRLSFQVQIEKKQTPFSVTKLNTVHTGVFTHQPNKYG